MAQTGVPFGEVDHVRRWMGIEEPVGRPDPEHPKRPIEGFACARSEVSGRRLWGLFSQRYPSARDFFADHFVVNYCPLVFMSASGSNITPDKLPAAEASPLYEACDAFLRELIAILQPRHLVGVGGFAEDCLRRAAGEAFPVGRILHPSPASPAANRDWAGVAIRQLVELNLWSA